MAATTETGGASAEREDMGSILEAPITYRNLPTVVLAGGVGGARMARALAAVLDPGDLTVVVNVGDDDRIYGVHVSADLDTVTYTLAGMEGPAGWGMADDTFTVMEHLAERGVDTWFRLGDRDLATCLQRTAALEAGTPLSAATAAVSAGLGVAATVLPVSDDPVRTKITTAAGESLDFQEYFVGRGHRDEVAAVAYEGAAQARPAPGVLEAIATAAMIVIAPSNPPLSVWPILAVPGVREAVAAKGLVVAVSPLFGGKALKGPADRVMASLGLPAGTAGVLAAYDGLLSHLVVDLADRADTTLTTPGVEVLAADTRLGDRDAAARFGTWICALGAGS
jgi:LPPG:FO 2-phospho-L-lactate transferase